MLLHAIKSLLRPIRNAIPLTEEDAVINAAKAGDVQPFIAYFRDRDVPFSDIDHRRKASPSGRVVYENDIYSYVYIDGVWVDRMEIPLPYEERRALFIQMESAVLSNVFGTVSYEKKHFNKETQCHH